MIRDIHNLKSEISKVSEQIEALSPQVSDVDARWIKRKKQALSAEFEETVRTILKQSSIDALRQATKSIEVASTHTADIAKTQAATLYWIVAISILTGMTSSVVTLVVIMWFELV